MSLLEAERLLCWCWKIFSAGCKLGSGSFSKLNIMTSCVTVLSHRRVRVMTRKYPKPATNNSKAEPRKTLLGAVQEPNSSEHDDVHHQEKRAIQLLWDRLMIVAFRKCFT